MERDSENLIGIHVMSATGLAKIPRKVRQCSTGPLESKPKMQVNTASKLSSLSPAVETKIQRKRSPIRAPGWEPSHTCGGIGSGRSMFSELKPKNISLPKTNRGKFERCNDNSESESDDDEKENVKNVLAGESDEEEEDIIKRPTVGRNQMFLDSDDEEAPEEEKAATTSGSIKRCRDSLSDDDGESSGKIQKKDADENSIDGCDIDLEDDEAAPAPVPKRIRTATGNAAPKKPTTITSKGINPTASEASAGASEVESDFDKNTREIMAHCNILKGPPEEKEEEEEDELEDDIMRNVLASCFKNACVGFLSNNCTTKPCDRPHQLPEMEDVRKTFAATVPRGIDEIYGVATKLPVLFDQYFGLLAENFIRCYPKEFEAKLARMIMDCERTARTHSLYRIVSDALVMWAKMPRYKAIQLIIKHHMESIFAHAALLEMILETGPDLIRFLDYLTSSCKFYPLSSQALDRIIENCVTFHDPRLPSFCLESMQQRDPEVINGLNKANVTKFIELQTYLTGENDVREEMLAEFISKVLQ